MSAENARIILYGLLDKCPFGVALDSCPLADMRQFPSEKKMKWARSLSPADVVEFVDEHERCFWNRMENDNN